MRRMTTGLVLTLSATCSDLRGSSLDQAIKLKTCTATANLLFVDISNYLGNYGPPFCNHYSYKFDFVNCLIHSDLERNKNRSDKSYTTYIFESRSLQRGGFEILDEGEEGVDVDGFGDEGEVADGQGALAVLLAGVAGDGDGGNVTQARQEA